MPNYMMTFQAGISQALDYSALKNCKNYHAIVHYTWLILEFDYALGTTSTYGHLYLPSGPIHPAPQALA
jgi:hypothetical protein